MKRKLLGIITLFILLAALPLASASLTITYETYYYHDAVVQSDRYHNVQVNMQNTGSVRETGLLELGIQRATGLQSLVSVQEVCDYRTPWNVHRTYDLAPGQWTVFILKATGIPDGTYYPVLVHTDMCCTDGTQGFPCEEKQPIGWWTRLRSSPITFGDASATDDDQCDTNYEAVLYVRANGQPNCAEGRCIDGSSLDSVAECAEQGVCADDSIQSTVCADGTSIDIRVCNQGYWQTTGVTCPGQKTPPEPAMDTGVWVYVAIIFSTLALVFILRKFGILRWH